MPLEFNDLLLYTDANGKVKVEVIYKEETFWLSQKKMAELFGVDRSVISKHLKNIFTSSELDEKSTVQFLHSANSDKPVAFYNLDAIIAVGYRVNSHSATQFRIWATATLKEFIVKGFVLDDERLKQGKRFGKDYFDELLERIREIRASERRFYQKITDIYRDCSYKTKPMLCAAPSEYLDLSLEVDNTQTNHESRQSLRMDNLSNKKKKELQQKMAALRELQKQRKSDAQKLVNPVLNPRYDEIYQEGVVWLESLSGEQFPSGDISVEFSDDAPIRKT